MKFSINKSELQNALTVVHKGVSTRSTLPILSGILLQAHDDTLTMQATDLELSVQYSVSTLIEEEGETVVPGKLFFDIVKNLPEAAVSLETAEQGVTVSCDSTLFSLKTLDPQDFPSFPSIEPQQTARIPFSVFAPMVKKVARVVSRDESRAILTGVLIKVEDTHLRMVATDSYCLAIADADLEEPQDEVFEAVISGSFLQDIASLPKADELISLGLSENQIVIKYQNTVFINRRLEGNFPNYQQLLPESHTTRLSIDPRLLIAAARRIALIDTKSTPVKFDINKDSQTLQLSNTAQDIGSAQETLPAVIEGEDMMIAFNHSYVIEGLNSIDDDTVLLEIQSPSKPGVFKTDKGEKFLYLIMPVKIS
ncbi:MAG: DNA polymerase III subunit beta [Eggerthellaceae bacterium]|jgi:DNA polymerase-3 subunit beta|nr:DNA polymerase III subunit beta [Eggerthellaceae bacterium]